MNKKLLDIIRSKAGIKLLFLPHAVQQMMKPDRMIETEEIHKVIDSGNIIEDYPEDARGQSCLILGYGQKNRPVHIVCAPKEDYLAIITAYIPDQDLWSNDFTTRRKR